MFQKIASDHDPDDHEDSASADPAAAPPRESTCHAFAPFVRVPLHPMPPPRASSASSSAGRVHVCEALRRECDDGDVERRRARRGSSAARRRARARAPAARCGGRRRAAGRSAGRRRRGRRRRAPAGRAASSSGQSTGSASTSPVVARAQPGDEPGDRRMHVDAVVANRDTAGRAPPACRRRAAPRTPRRAAATRAPPASRPPKRASAFGEPKRRLSPPTSSTPVRLSRRRALVSRSRRPTSTATQATSIAAPAAGGRDRESVWPSSAFIAAVGITSDARHEPEEQVVDDERPGEQGDHRRDLVAHDRPEPDADPGPERRRRQCGRAGAARSGWPSSVSVDVAAGEDRARRSPNASTSADDAEREPGEDPGHELRGHDARPLRREEQRRAGSCRSDTRSRSRAAGERCEERRDGCRCRAGCAGPPRRASEKRLLSEAGQHHDEQHEGDHSAEQPDSSSGSSGSSAAPRASAAITARGSEVSSRKTCSSDEPCGESSCSTSPAAAAISPTRSLSRRRRVARRCRRPSPRCPRAASDSCRAWPAGCARAPPAEPGRQLVERRLRRRSGRG